MLDEAIGELAASWPAPPMKCEILRARDHDAEAAIALRRALEGYSAARHKRGKLSGRRGRDGEWMTAITDSPVDLEAVRGHIREMYRAVAGRQRLDPGGEVTAR